jgi:hypothetical protein
MGSTYTSPPTNINGMPALSYDLTWTGSPVGTFSVQVSNSYAQAPGSNNTVVVLNAGSWSTLPASSFVGTYPVPAGTPGNGMLDIEAVGAAWIRLVYNYTSGTGTLTGVVAAKVF